jgi:multiple sugar transport system substrate-binding protein
VLVCPAPFCAPTRRCKPSIVTLYPQYLVHNCFQTAANDRLLRRARVWVTTRNAARASRVCALLSLVTSLWLAGCGSTAITPTAAPPGPTSTVTVPVDLPVVISIAGAFNDPLLRVLDQQIAAFEKANPDLLVEVVRAPGNAQERQNRFAESLAQGDSSRDIYVVDYHWLAALSMDGQLRPLDAFVEARNLELAAFLPAAAQASRIGDALLGLPWTADAGLLYYRQDLLERPPSTWLELEETALELAPAASLPYGYVWQAAAYDTLTCNTLEFVWAYGGEVFDEAGSVIFDSPETREALAQMAGLIASGASPREVTTYGEGATLEAYQSGQALMMRNWSYAWHRLNAPESALAGRVSLGPLPASCLGGQSLVLSASSQHPEEAFEFMTFLTDPQQQVQLNQVGVQPPALQAVYRDPALLAGDPALAELYSGLLAARSRPKTEDYTALSEVIYTEVHALLVGEQDGEVTAAEIQSHLEAMAPGR